MIDFSNWVSVRNIKRSLRRRKTRELNVYLFEPCPLRDDGTDLSSSYEEKEMGTANLTLFGSGRERLALMDVRHVAVLSQFTMVPPLFPKALYIGKLSQGLHVNYGSSRLKQLLTGSLEHLDRVITGRRIDCLQELTTTIKAGRDKGIALIHKCRPNIC
ncbi:hypothetical protein M422DRAFT_245872 [Sphaerobolus stellatus SS14]|nr:hypothetical protein M422DRAFT_245872 [Sphaerobolus stellatus SS14]